MHTPSVRAQIITRRTYNRPVNEEGTKFESWSETIDRCIHHQRWLWERAQGRALTLGQGEELEELRSLLLERKVGLSGRTFWLGGTDIAKSRELSQFNCLARETQFITNKGVRSFQDFNDGDQTVVLDHNGEWKNATVRSYGTRPLKEITLVRGRSIQKVRATENHTWILRNGSRTENLQVGDRLWMPAKPMNDWDFDNASDSERLYWAYGFVFGDGTLVCEGQNKKPVRSMVRMCGAKNKYQDRFTQLGFKSSAPLSCNGDFIAYTGTYLKTLPSIEIDGPDIVRAFVRGYLDADGAKSQNHNKSDTNNKFASIQVTGEQTIDWVRKTFPAVGVYITREHEATNEATNYGDRKDKTVLFGLSTSFGESNNSGYSVSNISDSGSEVVWCLEVEESKSFTLPNGVVTGNCSFLELSSVHDFVDLMWLLLNGVGVGFSPKPGSLNGFQKPVESIQVIRSTRTLDQWNAGDRGDENNVETFDPATRTWTIAVGDSAQAWAKAVGKLLAGKYPARTLVIDLSNIRAAGMRLRGYGWISSGDKTLAIAMEAIAKILSRQAGRLLSFGNLHDIANWCGTVLSTRRSAQIALCDYGTPNWREFATFKRDYWLTGNVQREQSNNSLVFWQRPSKEQLGEIFDLMLAAGGSEPGFINGETAHQRAPWFNGMNPCGEILLADKGFCNLVNINLGAFLDDPAGLLRATYVISRANYRQTCVDLRDGMLQEKWHQNNQFLRLCGVSLTGQAMRPDLTPYDYRVIRNEAVAGAYAMAVELDMPRPKNVTTGKPEGCRPATALVTTDQGIFQLSELLENHPATEEWSRIEGKSVTLDGQNYPVSNTFRNGVAPTKILKMAYGMEVQSTLNHPWWVEGRGWVETSEILPGDVLTVNIGTYRNEVASKLVTMDFSDRDLRRLDIKQPEEMTDDLAWLMGYLWGNGCMSTQKGRVRFISQHRATLEKVHEVMYQQFALNGANINRCTDRDAFVLDYASMNLMEWIRGNGLYKYDANDRMSGIPRAIRASSWKHIIHFLAGLFDADGCVSTHGTRTKCILSTASDTFAKHIQDVAAACGIVFGRSHNTQGTNCQKNGKSIWLMNISGHVTDDALEVLTRASVKLGDSGWRPKRVCKALGTVESVIDGDTIETFDVEVEDAHWFYAGAVKSHNTISKCMDATEGAHKPLAKYILNNVAFSGHDPLVEILRAANYRVIEHPTRPGDVVISLPVAWDSVQFTRIGDLDVNIDSAVSQLDHYKMLMDNYVEQNQSVTISYDPSEVPAIIEWLFENWDHYVGVSFLLRADPTKTAADLGYPYLPQQPVTKAEYDAYVAQLLPVNLEADTGEELLQIDDCSTGACPIR